MGIMEKAKGFKQKQNLKEVITEKKSILTETITEKEKALTEMLDMTVKDPSVPAEKKAQIIIHATSLLCGVIAAQPIPFADIFVLSPIQLVMVTYLNKVKGNPYKKSEPKEILTFLFGVLGWGTLAQHTILGLYKTAIPFLGAVTTVPLVYAATYALGKCAETVIDARIKDKTVSKEELKRISRDAKRSVESEKLTPATAKQMLSDLKKDSQEYKDFIVFLQTHDLLNAPSKENPQNILADRFRYIEQRFHQKYQHVRISEDALLLLSCYTHQVILEEIEPVIAQINFHPENISNSRKIQDMIEISRPFGIIQVLPFEGQYLINEIEPAAEYMKDNPPLKAAYARKGEETPYYNEEIRIKFHKMLQSAQKEILIMSPWVSWRVSRTVLPMLKAAANRGVHIKIVYGMAGNSSESGGSYDRDKASDLEIENYKRTLGEALSVKKQPNNTHVKICICDGAYLMGSYNFLSFDGQYGASSDQREENCTYGTNQKILQEWKSRYFT